MNEEFLAKYTAALNRATALAEKMQQKGVLYEGTSDDQLVRDFEQANAEVKRLTDLMLAANQ